jgi:hypothetical protein
VVAQGWEPPILAVDALARLDHLLHSLVRHLQRWASSRIGDIRSQLLVARELVLRLDLTQERRHLSPSEQGLRKRLKMRCLGLSSLERTMARERSRVRQLREGDANTAYFHLIARGRRRRNYIPALSVQGHVITNHDDMELALHSHFAGVFGSVQGGGFTINFEALGIQRLNLDEMDLAISSEEVWAAIRALPSDRAPGLDGFTGAFYKSAWPVIHQDVMDAVQAFQHGSTRNLGRLNSALIALLPKKVGASCPADFRPITMIHSFAKIISKVLALRLAPRLPDIVDRNQNAFVKARTIQDNYKYVQRAAVLIRKKKIPMLLLKLDISKAFDTLSWPFLLEVLKAHGFGDTWRRWIEQLLSTASSRILLNGRQGPRIKHLRGVRQGDSLSPMLFIIAMDVLNRLFKRAASDGVLRRMPVEGIKFQCSMYADDVILFIHPTV